jgi:hypothetical protein
MSRIAIGVDYRSDCPGLRSGCGKFIAVEIFSAQRDEQIARLDLATIGRDRFETHVRAYQLAIQYLRGLR